MGKPVGVHFNLQGDLIDDLKVAVALAKEFQKVVKKESMMNYN